MGRPLRCLAAALCLYGSLSAAHAQSQVWAIRGAHNTVFLGESVHLLKAADAHLPPAFERAYVQARTIVMEIDLSKVDQAQLQGWMFEHGTRKSGVPLRQALGDARFQRVAAASESLGAPLEMLEPFEPWVIALTLTELEYQKLGFDPEQGVERQIERRAETDHKELQGLETIDQQLGQLEQLTPEQQSRFLDLTLEDMKDAEQDTDQLLSAWRVGDTQRLASLLGEEYKTFPELYRALVTERNQHWMPQIERFLHDDHDYLVVVGALHLVGEGGLIELARRDGLTVTPLIAH
jgi:uncharacterized protein